jgi:hypothetical protein
VLSQLARAYLDAGYNHDAKEAFEHVTEMTPNDAGAWEALGRVWKRDWLMTLAPKSRDKAVHYLQQAVWLDASRAQAWTLLAVLRTEQGDARGAGLAAKAALAAAPESTDVTLANAYLAYRAGRLASAESLFTAAIPRLPRALALRFRDVTPLLPPQDGEELQQLSPAEHAEQVRRFWSVSDPDPTTRENEARLEYWSRIAHASLLFSDSWSRTGTCAPSSTSATARPEASRISPWASRSRGAPIRTTISSWTRSAKAACTRRAASARPFRCGIRSTPSSGHIPTSACSSCSRTAPSRSTTSCRGTRTPRPIRRPIRRSSRAAGCSPPRVAEACSRRCRPASVRSRSRPR